MIENQTSHWVFSSICRKSLNWLLNFRRKLANLINFTALLQIMLSQSRMLFYEIRFDKCTKRRKFLTYASYEVYRSNCQFRCCCWCHCTRDKIGVFGIGSWPFRSIEQMKANAVLSKSPSKNFGIKVSILWWHDRFNLSY